MAKNSNLHAAKVAKNDEFYTMLTDIEKEMAHYKDFFRGKTVYCNCDDARESNFFKYFSKNFEFLGLKKLITTGYKPEGKGVVLIYEGDKNGVPLSREFEFLRTYIKLMKLRYTDKVRISLDLPAEVPDKTIPPLMLISFVENAFKHGVSYQRDSFIEVKAELKAERLCFSCRNSKADKPNEEKGGVGLANVRKRLRLLYDNNYTLRIQDNPDIYTVELTIPL